MNLRPEDPSFEISLNSVSRAESYSLEESLQEYYPQYNNNVAENLIERNPSGSNEESICSYEMSEHHLFYLPNRVASGRTAFKMTKSQMEGFHKVTMRIFKD